MRTFLVINDNTAAADNAASFALTLAQKTGADLLIAHTAVVGHSGRRNVLAGSFGDSESVNFNITEDLKATSKKNSGFQLGIEELDISNLDEAQLAAIINDRQISMLVKGIAADFFVNKEKKTINIQTVLNMVLCPVLLVPELWSIASLERLVYMADLRYCRIAIVRYLAELARPWQADVSIAHLSAAGLPDMNNEYAQSLFNDSVLSNVSYNRLFFNNIKERDLAKAVDVIINGLQNDMLVLVNHRFHFEEIIGDYIKDTLPTHVTIPQLIFPA